MAQVLLRKVLFFFVLFFYYSEFHNGESNVKSGRRNRIGLQLGSIISDDS